MSSNKENYSQISPSEFFYRNRDLAGFSNPTRSLYTAVREFVENSLDACDQKAILPDVHLTIKAVDPEKQDPKPYILTVKDNGPGIEAKHVPLAFGTWNRVIWFKIWTKTSQRYVWSWCYDGNSLWTNYYQ
jgi:DNA topoisomerase-6 subunit B